MQSPFDTGPLSLRSFKVKLNLYLKGKKTTMRTIFETRVLCLGMKWFGS